MLQYVAEFSALVAVGIASLLLEEFKRLRVDCARGGMRLIPWTLESRETVDAYRGARIGWRHHWKLLRHRSISTL